MTTGIARIVKTDIGGTSTDISVLTSFQGQSIYAETKPMDFGTDRNKDLKGLLFDITDRGSIDSLQMYVGYQQRLNDTVTWAGPYSLADQDEVFWLPKLPQSRYWSLRVEDLLPITTWKWSGVSAYGRVVDPKSGAGPRGRL